MPDVAEVQHRRMDHHTTFCTDGFKPLPSPGEAETLKGAGGESITLTKNVMTADVTPATYGIRLAKRRRS